MNLIFEYYCDVFIFTIVNTEQRSVNFSYILVFYELILCLVSSKMKFLDDIMSKGEETGAMHRSRECAENY